MNVPAGSPCKLVRSLRARDNIPASVGSWLSPRQTGLVGLDRHARVPQRNWCVTLEDLCNFAAIVRDCQSMGHLPNPFNPNTGVGNPFHDDPEIGPNVHAVAKHVIIPKTSQAGGMSWALMLHPEGLSDVEERGFFFATHNWKEGIYEFHKKVSQSWPPDVIGMWCCFLALPQSWTKNHLKNMLGDNPLTDSPFARALQHAEEVLVVPNATESIYKRLWCVAEAKMAIDLEIPVRLAMDANSLDQSTLISVNSASMSRGSHVFETSIVGIGSYLRAEPAQRESSTEIGSDFISVKDATCSDPEDEERIRAAISGDEDRIDHLISELRQHGCYFPLDDSSAWDTAFSRITERTLPRLPSRSRRRDVMQE